MAIQSEDAIKAFDGLIKKDKTINYKKLSKEISGYDHDFTMFVTMGELLRQVYYGNILIPAAERGQDAFYEKIEEVKKYNPSTSDNINKKRLFKKIYKTFIMDEKWLLMHLSIKKFHWQIVLILNTMKENLVKNQIFFGWNT